MSSRDYWKDKNVFVTGCTGLLGSWLTARLVEYGASVVGLIRDLVPRSSLYEAGVDASINVVRGALEDFAVLQRALNEYEIDTVFHLGAQTIVGTANRSPLSTFEANIKGTWNVLEACRVSTLVKRIVVASSDKAYGKQEILPYSEEAPLQGRHPYDVSKSCADLLCRAYYETYGLPVCVTRCGNFYGGGDLNFNRIVPGTIRSVLESTPVIVRSDGSYVRDYLYIEDAVDAYLLLAERMDEQVIQGEAFNFSCENPITVVELVALIMQLMGSSEQPRVLNQATNEIPEQYLSARKAARLLGWRPQCVMEEGLRRTIAWYERFIGKE
jgi:CDP-glucose 4,6-dehydratase